MRDRSDDLVPTGIRNYGATRSLRSRQGEAKLLGFLELQQRGHGGDAVARVQINHIAPRHPVQAALKGADPPLNRGLDSIAAVAFRNPLPMALDAG